jgi:hypothetical protein
MLSLSLLLASLAPTTCHGFSSAFLAVLTTPLTNALTKGARFGGDEATMNYKIRALENRNELLQAQNLLYVSYVEEQGFLPAPGNPSEWKTEKVDGGTSILVDKFDSSCLWVGAFAPSNELMGVARMIERDTGCDNMLEMELYDDMKGQMKASGIPDYKYETLLECNRFAVAPNYRDSSVFWSLVMFCLELAYQNNLSIVSATPSPRLLIRMAGAKKLGSISYDPNETKSPTLIFFDQDELSQSMHKLDASFPKMVAKAAKATAAATAKHDY